MPRTYEWEFPLPRTHTGMLQANGVLGAMIWGEKSVLRLTIGRADFWDHRGGLQWTAAQSYAHIRDCLERSDEEGLRRLFEDTERGEGIPRRPSILPVGRIDIDFGRGAVITTGVLNIDDGTVSVRVRKGGRERVVRLALDMKKPVLFLSLPAGLKPKAIQRIPAWEYVGDYLRTISFAPPEFFDAETAAGWTQMRPADPHLGVGHRLEGRSLAIAAVYGESADAARKGVGRVLSRAVREGFTGLRERSRRWWKAYWRDVPRVDIPNERLRFLYEYGMYKFAGLTRPDGVAATLQGAWVEEYQMPPWSNDYHFNINVQMCYWPAYHGNRLEHLMPLFDLIEAWKPVLQHNARVFLGIDDGLMLPHAVDDRCICMGGFWTGAIDHGCTAWVAQMMYRYFRCSRDRKFLQERAYPFMVGAMRVYEEMLEPEGDSLVLPVSVSPEYRGAGMDAWGRNASFQLACIHRLCEDLIEAAGELGKKPRPVWEQIRDRLPKACLIGPADAPQIALWEGTPLEESHRHHSHLAGIVPFDVFDLGDSFWLGVVERSLAHWIRTGPGLWSGWCVPWASMIHARVGNAEAAELWLEIWERVFTNEGSGTLHDVHFPGFSLMGRGGIPGPGNRREIMQIEAGMSCVAAVQEMLLHVRRGVTVLFRGAPQRWPRVGFENARTDGAFLVSARRTNGRVGPVQVRSLAGGIFRLENPWDGEAVVHRKGRKVETLSGRVLEVRMKKGETVQIAAR